MNKKAITAIILAILILIIILLIYFIGKKTEQKDSININTDLSIVTSLEDEITDNTAWCGTFNLIWNDLKNEIAKQDIIFKEQTEIVNNLNKGTFNTSHISENSYYKVYGKPSLELKTEIEKAIKEKFNETSDILNDFDWNNRSEYDYFLYAMLKKEFEFPKVFDDLETVKFKETENVKYFGIKSDTDEEVRAQVKVLYYENQNNFAIKLITKNNDEVIITKGNKESNFKKIYENILEQNRTYKGKQTFGERDTLKIPNINFNLKKEITEVENKPFTFANGEEYEIEKAMQTIKFELDKKGGKIKSEAGMMVKDNMAVAMPEEPREFNVDNTFTIFLKEKDKELPYFAAKISNIKNVQWSENKYYQKVCVHTKKVKSNNNLK